ncbi:hypothetical protein FI206_02530 [Salmonella enterica subsp. enterica]|nr:hypothetical protein [Salmonella enterica subsp. enterica serovar Hessarek]
MTKQERKNKYDVNTIEKEQMVVDCHMTEEQVDILLAYRDKFKMLEGDDSALVNLEELWVALGTPRFTHSVHVGKSPDKYNRAKSQAYSEWVNEIALPTLERLKTQICVTEQKTRGRGANKKIRSIDTESAKALAMMANSEEGDIVRRYFIVMEKLFKEICQYNHLRIQIEQNAKDVSYQMGFKFGNHKLGGIMKERHNKLVKIINGKRNKFKTNLNKSLEIGEYVKNLMLNGFSDTQIVQMLSH